MRVRCTIGFVVLMAAAACDGGGMISTTVTTPSVSHTSASNESVTSELPVGFPDSAIVDLTPTDAVLRQQCQEAADLLGFPVPCPSALPPTNQPVRCRIPGDFAGADVTPKEGCALGSGFILAPSRFTNPELFHLVIEGSLSPRVDCGVDDPHRRIAIDGAEGFLADCSELAGLVANHVLVRIQVGEVFVDVSVHDHTEDNRSVVVAIAQEIAMVEPSGR